jgi:hypothetical protein
MTTIAVARVPRVNLLPPSELARRDRAKLTRRWFWAGLATLLVVVALVAGAFALKWVADQQLAAEQATTNDLLLELSALSEVSRALATETELSAFQSEALGADFAWQPVIASITSALPAGVTLAGFDVVTGGIPQGADPAIEEGLVGVIRLESPTAIDMPATIRAVRALPSVIDADGRLVATSLAGVGAFQYEISVVFDQSIYSGAYAQQGE